MSIAVLRQRRGLQYLCCVHLLVSALLTGCAALPNGYGKPAKDSPSNSDHIVNSGYQPSEPLYVEIAGAYTNDDLLYSLPNETVRVAYGLRDVSGDVRFGPLTAKASQNHVVITLDYIKYRMYPVPVDIEYTDSRGNRPAGPYRASRIDVVISDSEDGSRRTKSKSDAKDEEASVDVRPSNERQIQPAAFFEPPSTASDPIPDGSRSTAPSVLRSSVPVYIGIGIRVRADVTILAQSGGFDIAQLTDLIGLAVAAKNNQVSGTLIVQTLGITGSEISPYIPAPAEINATTIASAMQAIATIRSKLYTSGTTDTQTHNVVITPAIVAFDDYFGMERSSVLLPVALLERPLRFEISETSKRSIVSITTGPPVRR